MNFYNINLILHYIFCIYYFCVIYLYSWYCVFLQTINKHKKPKILSQQGRVGLITGGGCGIGYETSLQLLQSGMTLIIAGIKNDEIGFKLLQQKFGDRVKFVWCDLSSLKSVDTAVEEFESLDLPLHVLINNAGIMFAPRSETEDGFEGHWMVNYLGHFYLTHLVLPKLKANGTHERPSRIVNLSSCLHFVGHIDFDNIHGRSFYCAEYAYTQSKLAMAIFAISLTNYFRRLDFPVIANSVHPAIASSNIFQHVVWKHVPGFLRAILKTPAMASDSVVFGAVSEEVLTSGNYFDNCRSVPPLNEAADPIVQERLWRLSCVQTKITEY